MNKILQKIVPLLSFCLLTALAMSNLNAAENIFNLTINETLPGESESKRLFGGQFLIGEEVQRDVQLSPHAGYQAVLDPDPSTGTCILSFKDDNTISYHILSTQSAGELTATVTYAPAEVSYTVNYYQQNVANNDYTLVEARTLYGTTGTMIDAATIKDDAHTYDGFARRPFLEDTTIAADGTTVINVYNDRNYYMLSFDPNGAPDAPNAMFMRYGTPTTGIQAPERSGYAFTGWLPALPDTMPAENVVCKAQWSQITHMCDVTYIFWGETSDVDGGSPKNEYLGQLVKTYDDQVKSTASYTDLQDSEIVFPNKAGYTKMASDTDVPILADGTTVVNIYFSRNKYTITLHNKNGASLATITAPWGTDIHQEWYDATHSSAIHNFKWTTKAKPT